MPRLIICLLSSKTSYKPIPNSQHGQTFGGKVSVGVLSEHDILAAFNTHGDQAKDQMVLHYMTLDLTVTQEDDTIDNALKLMVKNNVRHMPVVSKKGRVVSFLSVLQILTQKIAE